jgi:hypothetical protein
VFANSNNALAILDKAGKIRLVYTAPIIRLPSNITRIPDLEWDPSSATLSFNLPDVSFPIIIAFGVAPKLPDVKGGVSFSFPAFKFGAEGELETSDSSDSEDEDKKKRSGTFGFGLKAPKFGKGDKPKIKVFILF